MNRFLRVGLAATLITPLVASDALARGSSPAGRGTGLHGPALGRALPHHAGGYGHRRALQGYGYGYGYPFGFYPPPGYGYGGLGSFEGRGGGDIQHSPARPTIPEALGIRPQPVGVPTLTVISTDPRTGRSRAVVYEVGAGAVEMASPPGPRIARVRRGR